MSIDYLGIIKIDHLTDDKRIGAQYWYDPRRNRWPWRVSTSFGYETESDRCLSEWGAKREMRRGIRTAKRRLAKRDEILSRLN